MTTPVEVTVTAPGAWVERSEQLAQLLRTVNASGGPGVIPDPTGRPPDPAALTVIVSPAAWADDPRLLRQALELAAGDSGAKTPRSETSAAGAVAPVGDRLVFTVEEAASVLGISRSFAYEAVQRGEIPSMRIGRRILVPKAALAKLLEAPRPSTNAESANES